MRIVIAEDSGVLRDGLAELLTSRGHEVSAAVGDGDTLRAAVADHRPDVVIVDIRLPPTFTDEGLRAAITLRRHHRDQAVLVFSHHVETRYANKLLAGHPAGVGYLLKDRVADASDFVDALNRVAAGQTVLDPEVISQLLTANRTSELDALSPREREVLTLMAEGRSNAAIAKNLVLTYGSVEKHVTSIFTKLQLPSSGDDHRRVLAVLRYLKS
jgi:DNA-binding NarL/FixJ family response regulator